MSVGWRSKDKDAYDVTSFTINYNSEPSKVTFEAIDGEAFGSIESKYYNLKWNELESSTVDTENKLTLQAHLTQEGTVASGISDNAY